MRPFVVVEGAEAIEGPLLDGPRGAWRPTGAGFERAVHAFVRAVLLRGGGPNALVLDPQAHPPNVELREAVDAAGREGHAVVCANGPRQPELAEGVFEGGSRSPALDVRELPCSCAI